ncbi:hypothetical protein AVEN_222422-1 [Araneus ventricosus]|uniref:Uncharacterized protein n=1 Tax=Araneus ventricosus TaxID=182803 RepID=A0A4Y2J9I5_ARAVE|nr:hypothetical protein AVEN_222422-1 [Araneus ventricosus]
MATNPSVVVYLKSRSNFCVFSGWCNGILSLLQGREFSIKILQIRNYDLITENAIEFDDERDITFFYHSIDYQCSFQHVTGSWIPLFKDHFGDTTAMAYMDLERINRQTRRNLQLRVSLKNI